MIDLLAFIHQDRLSKLFFGEIKDNTGKIKSTTFSSQYVEILHWAREHHARVVNLDVAERLQDYLN